MKSNDKSPVIIADYRENPSGIPALLSQYGAEITVAQMKTGDYSINEEIVVERKSAEDLIQSLVANRLFTQCSRLSATPLQPLLLLEGNPFQTGHQIDPGAIKGALLSISTSWRIPVVYSENTEDSAVQLLMLGRQMLRQNEVVRLHSYKPKRLKNHRLRFIQGFPQIGPATALRLYEHFGSIEAIVNADINELKKVEGIGKKTAEKIREFVGYSS